MRKENINKKFYQMTILERQKYLAQKTDLTESDLHALRAEGGLSAETADHMVEKCNRALRVARGCGTALCGQRKADLGTHGG